ncbi:MAG: hypothetical protein ACM37W_00285 [Actinomycetota bacterium]
MYDAYTPIAQSPPPPPNSTDEGKDEGKELANFKTDKSPVLSINNGKKNQKKSGLLLLALLPLIGVVLVARLSITPASDPLPNSPSPSTHQPEEESGKIIEASTPKTEGDGIDLETLIKRIDSSKENARKSIAIAREQLSYSLTNLYLDEMRKQNKAHQTPPEQWWLAKAKEKESQFATRAGRMGDITTYDGIKNWLMWLAEVDSLLSIHDLLIQANQGQQVQVVSTPNVAIALSQYQGFVELALAGDAQAIEQMRAASDGVKTADKYRQEVKRNYDQSLNRTH